MNIGGSNQIAEMSVRIVKSTVSNSALDDWKNTDTDMPAKSKEKILIDVTKQIVTLSPKAEIKYIFRLNEQPSPDGAVSLQLISSTRLLPPRAAVTFGYNAYIADEIYGHEVAKCTWRQVSDNIENLIFDYAFRNAFPEINGVGTVRASFTQERFALYAVIYINVLEWSSVWKIKDFYNCFIARCLETGRYSCTAESITDLKISPLYSIKDTGETLESSMEAFKSDIATIYKAVVTELQTQIPTSENAVSIRFDFPEAVKVPCEQYLLYFAEFLKDVGVDATANLNHEAGATLFTVTPDDKETALDKIREALGVYLCLAADPSAGSISVYDQPTENLKMAGNVQSFQMQLMYANAILREREAEIQHKDAAIRLLQVTVEQQRTALAPATVITPEVFVQSVQAVSSASQDKDAEKLFKSTVELTKYEGPGFKINVAQAYRLVRDLFTKKDKPDATSHELTARDEPGEPGW